MPQIPCRTCIGVLSAPCVDGRVVEVFGPKRAFEERLLRVPIAQNADKYAAEASSGVQCSLMLWRYGENVPSNSIAAVLGVAAAQICLLSSSIRNGLIK